MANTRRANLRLRIKPGSKKFLAKLAKSRGSNSTFLAANAVESYIADEQRLLSEVRDAEREVASGHYIKHEDMKAWLLSWGTDRELPPQSVSAVRITPRSPGEFRDCLVSARSGAAQRHSSLRRSG
jgi:predicted transcriptional regulator